MTEDKFVGVKGYLYLKIHGMAHQVSFISRETAPMGTETACGLPVTKMMEHDIYFAEMDHMKSEDFCEMCYDHLALKTLANI